MEEGGPHVFLSHSERIPWPPPYALAAPSVPLLPLSAPLIRELSKMKAVLKAQIGGLKQVLTLQHELSDLSSQIRELQLTMGTDPSQDKQKNPNPNIR